MAIIVPMLRRNLTILLVLYLTIFSPGWIPVHGEGLDTDGPPAGYIMLIHPDNTLYIGDQVSFQVQAPPGVDMNKKSLQVSLGTPRSSPLSKVDFGQSGFENRFQAILPWVWNTDRLSAGLYQISFQVEPGGPSWTQAVLLNPALPDRPQWVAVHSACCVINYITGTAAERDIEQIKTMADAQAQDVAGKLHAAFKDPIPINLMSKVLGHGGFTANEIYISYLDRNYADSNPELVLHHEMVHLLDSQLGGDFRPTFFVEGLAVYLSGGHFKSEPLLSRAAALPHLDLYLPLTGLADNFYASQHEIGYLEAAALINFMVNTWGWETFSNFYRHMKPIENAGQSATIDAALKAYYHLSFQQLEDRFLDALAQIPVNPDLSSDVRLTVDYFDAMRRYQMDLDPATYFREAWLPDGQEMRKRGITADLLRHPDATENQTIELMLIDARLALDTGLFDEAEQGIRSVNAVLLEIEHGSTGVMSAHPLAAQMYAAVMLLEQCGMEPQRIHLDISTGQAAVIVTWPIIQNVTLLKTNQGWQTQPACQPAPLFSLADAIALPFSGSWYAIDIR